MPTPRRNYQKTLLFLNAMAGFAVAPTLGKVFGSAHAREPLHGLSAPEFFLGSLCYAAVCGYLLNLGFVKGSMAMEASGIPFERWLRSVALALGASFLLLFIASVAVGSDIVQICVAYCFFGILVLLDKMPTWIGEYAAHLHLNSILERLMHGSQNGPRRTTAQGFNAGQRRSSKSTPTGSVSKPVPKKKRRSQHKDSILSWLRSARIIK